MMVDQSTPAMSTLHVSRWSLSVTKRVFKAHMLGQYALPYGRTIQHFSDPPSVSNDQQRSF